MAFPTNPTDGQHSGIYKYDASINSWRLSGLYEKNRKIAWADNPNIKVYSRNTMGSIYIVPAGKVAYVLDIVYSLNGTSNAGSTYPQIIWRDETSASVELLLWLRPYTNGEVSGHIIYEAPLKLPEGHRISLENYSGSFSFSSALIQVYELDA